jgi:hypothetical protein
MHTTTTETSPELSALEVRILALASIGAALEMYDFTIFVFFTNVIRPAWELCRHGLPEQSRGFR